MLSQSRVVNDGKKKIVTKTIYMHNCRDNNKCSVCGRPLIPGAMAIKSAMEEKRSIVPVTCQCKGGTVMKWVLRKNPPKTGLYKRTSLNIPLEHFKGLPA